MFQCSVRMTGYAMALSLWSCLQCLAAPPQQSLYPIAVGSKWIYEAAGNQLVEEVTGYDIVDGERCARVETSINGKVVAYEHLAFRSDGLYRVSIAGERVVPPLCFLKYPSPKGGQWAVASQVNGIEIAGQFSLGQANITVPAGEFDAVTVHGTRFESEAGPLEFTYYFVPGVGKVKQVISTKNKSTELVLKEYQPAR
ncbi:hypothetical protein SH661x_004516 [Planctomicrobium sp. SH661]|uniref:hypothetical protein n=1 Tax=Planctomicrobium sp. SH661 TaxID=3448124 RepID=UPI003F5C3532